MKVEVGLIGDRAAGIFLLCCISIVRICDPETIEQQAERNDANRTELLGLTGIVMAVLLISIAAETAILRPEPATKIVIIATLLLAWLFSNMVYALHYAHMAYMEPGKGSSGLEFPNTAQPVYWDFIYFAFTIGMTFQTSDVAISSDRIRRVVTVFRELREGVTADGRAKVKSPSATLSTAEVISVVTHGLALAAHFGDGVLRPADVAAGIVGAVVQDPVSDRVVWQEYLEAVVRERKDWRDFYRACREASV